MVLSWRRSPILYLLQYDIELSKNIRTITFGTIVLVPKGLIMQGAEIPWSPAKSALSTLQAELCNPFWPLLQTHTFHSGLACVQHSVVQIDAFLTVTPLGWFPGIRANYVLSHFHMQNVWQCFSLDFSGSDWWSKVQFQTYSKRDKSLVMSLKFTKHRSKYGFNTWCDPL